MSTKKIEFLADRRASLQDSSPSLRALRHLDAARGKLEKLQATRRQLKLEIEKYSAERDAALAQVESLKLLHNTQSNELHDLSKLSLAQAKKITQLREDCLRLQDSIRQRPPRRRDEDGPALTVLAMEKVATESRIAAATKSPAEPATAATGFFNWFLRRINPNACNHDQ